MPSKFSLCLLPVVLCSTAWSPSQTAHAKAERPDPLDANSSVPRLAYTSSLAGYQRMREQPVGSWRGVNETVTRIGGWRAYAKEAAEENPGSAQGSSPGTSPARSSSAAAEPNAAQTPAQGSHSGHKKP
jgi:hypothetical protein